MMDDANNPYRQSFEEPVLDARPKSNPLAIVGFVLAFCIPPIGLLLSFIALFMVPRAFAIAGVIIGLIGSVVLAVVGWFFVTTGVEVAGFIDDAAKIDQAISGYVSTNPNTAPPDLGALSLDAAVTTDPWGQTYKYTPGEGGEWTLTSAGKDATWDTGDDITIDSTMNPEQISTALSESLAAFYENKYGGKKP